MSTHIVTDLGFGDSGKGTMVDAIARRCSSPPLVVRHNGGAQAGHNVHTADGRHHTFSQFGAATFVPGSRTLLSKHFILHPLGLHLENAHLASLGVRDAFQRLVIDERSLVITPYQQAANRLREMARGDGRHGSCGLGIGETVADSLEDVVGLWMSVRVADLGDPVTLRRKFSAVREWKLHQMQPLRATLAKLEAAATHLSILDDSAILERAVEHYVDLGKFLRVISASDADLQIRESEHVIFEGAQGVLLDEWLGFHPHTTWSTTTTANADAMIEESCRTGPVERIGVVRAYATRHGHGPFPTEDAALTQQLRDTHNTDTGPQGSFRVGWFDAPLTRYALSACPGITSLAVTCLDRLANVPEWSVCEAYAGEDRLLVNHGRDLAYQEQLTHYLMGCKPVLRRAPSDVPGYTREIEQCTGLPVSVISLGPTAEDKRWA